MTAALVTGRGADLGDRMVHLVETPGAQPTIVLLGGCGVPYYQWDDVVTDLDGLATVRLDRPGLTDTPWPGVLPTLAAEVATLDDLVHTLPAPPVFVAHSMAGPHAEAFARLYPGRLAGLVLVDGSVDANPRPQRSGPAWLLGSRLVHLLAAVPPLRLFGSFADRVLVTAQSGRRLRDPARPVAKAVYRSRDAVASVVAEQAAFRQQLFDLESVRREHPWPELPTIVLTAGHAGDGWVEVQRDLADRLAAEHVVLPESRHMIMIDEPKAVVAAVTRLVTRLRASTSG